MQMLTMEAIRKNEEIMNCLDLEMTSEKAVSLYLEWGSSWAHGKDFVRSADDASCFFTVDAWESPVKLFLVRQTSGGRDVVGEVEAPSYLVEKIVKSWGGRKGTYGISGELEHWIRQQLSDG
ncbi:MAG: hypothetical protein JRJ12_09025 [Deltaproteobacteria bacterium]|nr:hypothetical protein [Deltaproteobacteria bacterium]MBW2071901.1 hypothetical protein [Deltaproteobacteria bacterium]